MLEQCHGGANSSAASQHWQTWVKARRRFVTQHIEKLSLRNDVREKKEVDKVVQIYWKKEIVFAAIENTDKFSRHLQSCLEIGNSAQWAKIKDWEPAKVQKRRTFGYLIQVNSAKRQGMQQVGK